MLKLINDTTGTYKLTIEYKEKEYNYTARCISREAGVELWFIWANKKMLTVEYNTATKKLSQQLQYRQPQSIPEDFLNVLEQSFQQKK